MLQIEAYSLARLHRFLHSQDYIKWNEESKNIAPRCNSHSLCRFCCCCWPLYLAAAGRGKQRKHKYKFCNRNAHVLLNSIHYNVDSFSCWLRCVQLLVELLQVCSLKASFFVYCNANFCLDKRKRSHFPSFHNILTRLSPLFSLPLLLSSLSLFLLHLLSLSLVVFFRTLFSRPPLSLSRSLVSISPIRSNHIRFSSCCSEYCCCS